MKKIPQKPNYLLITTAIILAIIGVVFFKSIITTPDVAEVASTKVAACSKIVTSFSASGYCGNGKVKMVTFTCANGKGSGIDGVKDCVNATEAYKYAMDFCDKACGGPTAKPVPAPSVVCAPVDGSCVTSSGTCHGYSNSCEQDQFCAKPFKPCPPPASPSPSPSTCYCPVGAACKLPSWCNSPPPTADPSSKITCAPALYRVPNYATPSANLAQYISPANEVNPSDALVTSGEYFVHGMKITNVSQEHVSTAGLSYLMTAESINGDDDFQKIFRYQDGCSQSSPNTIKCPVEHFSLAPGQTGLLQKPLFASLINGDDIYPSLSTSGYHIRLKASQSDYIIEDCGSELMQRPQSLPIPYPSSSPGGCINFFGRKVCWPGVRPPLD